MTPEKQLIAIAEACGWHNVHFDYLEEEDSQGGVCGIPPRNVGLNKNHDYVPNYLNDLNAMHDAEGILDGMSIDTRSLYYDYLMLMHAELFEKSRDGLKRDPFNREWVVIRSTAAQRAEAFLRCIGKWEEA